jgi:hypothetical protein
MTVSLVIFGLHVSAMCLRLLLFFFLAEEGCVPALALALAVVLRSFWKVFRRFGVVVFSWTRARAL